MASAWPLVHNALDGHQLVSAKASLIDAPDAPHQPAELVP
jgi:hypothetical protein